MSDGHRPARRRGPAGRGRGTRRRHRRRGRRSTSRPARCSGWSASRARARRRSASRCSATPAAARGSRRLGPRRRRRRAGAASADELRRLRGKPGLLRAAGSGVGAQPGAADRHAARSRCSTAHGYGGGRAERRERIAEMLARGAAPDDPAFLRRYPHQLSGGQQQRVGIAMAFACRPRVIVLDEPTTGLDVTTQAHVLAHGARGLCGAHGVAALYVSHDLAVVANLADRVAVMYAGPHGRGGPRPRRCSTPRRIRTRAGCVEAIPHMSGRHALVGIPGRAPSPGSRPDGCFFAPRCELADRRVPARSCPRRSRSRRRTRCAASARTRSRQLAHGGAAAPPTRRPRRPRTPADAARGATPPTAVQVAARHRPARRPRECLALVGESGSGKTTLARCIAGLHAERDGEILLDGQPLGPARGRGRGRAQAHPVRLPEPVRLAQPAPHGRRDRRPAARAVRRAGGSRRRRGSARCSSASRCPPTTRPLPRPALGRRAAAGGDRPGAGVRARPAHLRRGHLGARRVGAGGDRRAAGRPAARHRPRHAVRHAQPAARPLDRAARWR